MFQKSILDKYLKQIDEIELSKAFSNLSEFNSKIENIKKVKESNYQYGFLEDFFVKALGYALNPSNDYNLTTEYKNESDSKQADGAIIRDNKPIAVIELKSTKTKSMESIVNQAFSYKNNHPTCCYVITSNFEYLRFYIEHSNEFMEFNLFNLTFESFKRIYLLLSKENLFNDLPKQIKEDSKANEESITNKFYKEYSTLRMELFENLKINNSKIDEIELLRLTQKLLDRFIFIFFAEDRFIIESKTVERLIQSYKNDFSQSSLFTFIKSLFSSINSGNPRVKIFAYNGGLFAEDIELNSLIIDDNILLKVLELNKYDFDSELDVDILGHIFENSLSDLDELKAILTDRDFDKKTSKRKKDGVFYTPNYITEYIVENTLGSICEKKKIELKIDNFDIFGEITKESLELFSEYKEFLINLKILDPACGSGAFLNQAFNYLTKEYKLAFDVLQKYAFQRGDLLLFEEIDILILENNLFGVDINQEAVEIARLSLWLKTAKRERKLVNLNDNIKVGNSLIDDKEIDSKAFKWQEEFKEIFDNGGFDIVIGNPPYIRVQGLKANYEKEANFYSNSYKSAFQNYDIYVLFMEKSFNLINQNGKVGFILPHKFLISEFGKGIREFLLENRALESLIHFGSEMVFDVASTYTCILTLSNANQNINFANVNPKRLNSALTLNQIDYRDLTSNKWTLKDDSIISVLNKIDNQPLKVKDIFSKIFQGIATSGDDVYLIDGVIENNFIKGYSKALNRAVEIERDLMKPILKGEDISRYKPLKNRYFVIFPYLIENSKASPMSEEYIKNNFPNGYEYLKANEKFLRAREKGKMDIDGWFLYIYPKSLTDFEQEKIITPDISFKSNMSLDRANLYHGTTLYSFIKKDEIRESYQFYLSIFNSALMWFFMKNRSTELRGGYFRFKTKYLEPFGIPKIKNIESTKPFEERADLMLKLNEEFTTIKNEFLDEIKSYYKLKKLNTKLESFELLSFDEFRDEIAKVTKIKFTSAIETKKFKEYWSELFNLESTKLKNLQKEIDKTDREIDEMVYKLYNLNEDEIRIVEESR